jgi:hypothetical protein
MQVAAYTAGQRHAICNLHDAEQVLFGRGASAGLQPRAEAGPQRLQREVRRRAGRCKILTIRRMI